MSSSSSKRRKEDTGSKKEPSKGTRQDSKRTNDKQRKREEEVKKRQSTSSTKPTDSPKTSPFKQPVTHSFKTTASPKASPTLTHSPRKSSPHSPTLTPSRSKTHDKPTTSTKNSNKRIPPVVGSSEKRGVQKPHPLSKTHVQLHSDEEIEEELITINNNNNSDNNDKEEMVSAPIPMEEVSEDLPSLPHHDDNDDEYLNEEFEEDYEEDFEVDSNHSNDKVSSSSDIDDILQAIGQENEKVQEQSTILIDAVSPSAPPPPPHLSPRPNIAFTNMTQKMKETSRKIQTRATELSSMIDRETLSINLFELQPLTEYGLYMRSFGQANTSQTGCQTGYDLMEEETQTDTVSYRNCWTQWPPHDMKGYGRDDYDDDEIILQYDSKKLLKFLEKAGQLCELLLEEEEEENEAEMTWQHQNRTNSTNSQYYHKEGSITINDTIHCINGDSDVLLVGSCTDNVSGLIKVYNISRTGHPLYILGDHSVPLCCSSWYPLIFAGNDDGSINLWDLREPPSLHKNNSTINGSTVRVPTYTTAAYGSDQKVGHTQPVIHLVTTSGVQYDQWQCMLHDGYIAHGLSFQLLSMDASGLICVWVIVELLEGDMAGNIMDHGLAPGGRVKLIKSTTINVLNGIDNCVSTTLTVSRNNVNTLLVGTDTGSVVCHVRYKTRALHKQYQLKMDLVNSEVTSISFHPHFKSHFIVAYTSGHISLFHLQWPHPLITWPPYKGRNESVKDITWHPDWSNVFICTSGLHEIHIWDLLSIDSQPVHVMKLENRLSHLRLLQSKYHQSSVIAISTSQEISLYTLEQSCFKQYKDHLKLFENYLSALNYY